ARWNPSPSVLRYCWAIFAKQLNQLPTHANPAMRPVTTLLMGSWERFRYFLCSVNRFLPLPG
ncbi:MAG: hypothetical protein SFW36_14930, partial [Leptolyngbyaceae cyanobacterium bins.59]|nr:hypothetical protein [Leptolyngbyaceae cyanobacterium bins.59]